MVTVVVLDKKLGQPLGRDVVGNAFGENAFARLFDGLDVNIGGKNLDIASEPELIQRFTEQNGERIRLLAGRAAGAPDTDGLILGRVLHDVVNGAVLELFKKRGVAEKVGHADEDFLDQNVRFVGAAVKVLGVFGQTGVMGDDQAAFNAAQHRCALVIGKVNAAGLFEHGIDVGKGFVVRKQRVVFFKLADRVMLKKADDFAGNFLRGQNPVGKTGTDGAARHSVKLRCRRVLHDGQAAVLFDGLGAVGAV